MEYFEEVNQVLGSENVQFILDEVRDGRIKRTDMKKIALSMKDGVYGVFVQRKDTDISADDLMKELLDAWFNNHLYQYTYESEPLKGLCDLIDILASNQVRLNYQAHTLKKKNPTLNALDSTVLKSPLSDFVQNLIGRVIVPTSTTVSGVRWIRGKDRKRGKIIFPGSFSGKIETEIASSGYLNYYGVKIITGREELINVDSTNCQKIFKEYEDLRNQQLLLSFLERHTNFQTYTPDNHHTLNGYIVFGKFNDISESVIDMTGFQVPQGETILVPAGVIHSNNYLQGGWNNIIAIEPDDEVSMVKKGKRFSFSFSNKCEPLLHTTEKQKERTEQIGVIPHDGPIHPTFASVAARLKTFEQWPPALKQKPTEMAEAGLIYLGLSDKVKCFYCDGGLNEWGEDDNPWVEHAGWFNKCGFMRLTKGDQFIEECRQFVNMTVENRRAAMRNHMETKNSATEQDNNHPLVKDIQKDKSKISLRASSSDVVLEDVDNEVLIDENTRLKEQKTCKVCMDAEVGVVFLPCGHLVVCVNCAPNLKTCAVCRSDIKGTVRTFLS